MTAVHWLAVDPGINSMGVLRMDDGTIVTATTFTTASEGPVPDWAGTLKRAERQVASLEAEVLDHRPAFIVAEAYEDFGGQYKRGVRNRWMTPVLLGMMAATFGELLVWQPAGAVLTRYGPHKRAWAEGRTGLLPGDELLTNDHTRSAACHALAYLAHAQVLQSRHE